MDEKIEILQDICPRLKNESRIAYACFRDFVEDKSISLGKLHKLYQKIFNESEKEKDDSDRININQYHSNGKELAETRLISLNSIRSWNFNHNWVRRRDRWYDHLRRVEETEMLKHRFACRLELLKASEHMIKNAQEMLEYPITKQKIESVDGKEITIIEPAKWTARDITTFLDIANKINKEAVGDELAAMDLLKRRGYNVFEPNSGDIAIALNALVAAKIIPPDIVPNIIEALRQSDDFTQRQIQTAFSATESQEEGEIDEEYSEDDE